MSSFAVNYDISQKVFYNFYEMNPFVSSVIDKIRRDVGAHGYEIRRHKKISEQSMKEFEKLLTASV